MPRVTATTLASHAHFQCDLYIHQAYHGLSSSSTTNGSASRPAHPEHPAAIQQAALTSGDTWESALFRHLDEHGLLLSIQGPPLNGSEIGSVIELEERSHFYVAGIEFWPPRERYVEEYLKRGVDSVHIPNWGLAKPDLVEMTREDDGTYIWRIIDAKASKDVKTSHLVQTYFYHLCLTYMLPPSFKAAETVAIWLPTRSVTDDNMIAFSPSLSSLHPTAVAPLIAPLSELLFKRLPTILSMARQDVPWHFNPLCRSCPYSSTCRTRLEMEGELGAAGEVTLREAGDIKGFLKLSRTLATAKDTNVDIEDIPPVMAGDSEISEIAQLATLLQDDSLLEIMERRWPASYKRVQRILDIQHHKNPTSRNYDVSSPVIDAALTKTPQFKNRRIYTLPAAEDIAIFISLIIDPSRLSSESTISEFCISTYIAFSFQQVAYSYGFDPPRHVHGIANSLVSELADCIRGVLRLHGSIGPNPGAPGDIRNSRRLPRTQIYVWSVQERDAIQNHLIAVALGPNTSHTSATMDAEDVRLCIGALCEGASLLSTAFQPHILEGALLGFLGKKGKSKEELISVMHRLGIPVAEERTVEAMRQRIMTEIERLGSGGTLRRDRERRTVGLLPRVVVLKKELQRLVAIPVPGWWDVKEAASIFRVLSASRCPDESEIFRRYWDGDFIELKHGMEGRNNACLGLVSEIRQKVQSLPGRKEVLVNNARVLSAEWRDVCRVDVLRKLFFMQQFEVLLKMQELWNSRIEACPEAPLLIYRGAADGTAVEPKLDEPSNATLYMYTVELVAGNVEVVPERDRDRSFFDYLLVEEDDDNDEDSSGGGNVPDTISRHLPLEALFDDLSISGLVFPLNQYTRNKWEDGQPREVKEGRLWVADIQDVKLQGGKTKVLLKVWSSQGSRKPLSAGKKYRLSPRLVDFNTNKVLSTLVELDLQVDSEGPSMIQGLIPPFVQLITSPKSLGNQGYYGISPGEERAKKNVLDAEASLHRLYTELQSLGNDDAGALILKASQRKAAQRILKERLTVIWGPPGSGKSYTIALSLLRMLEIQARSETPTPPHSQIIFLTAMTHAAIQACLSKLRKLMGRYRVIPNIPLGWIDQLNIEHVLSGSTHRKPPDLTSRRKTRASNHDAMEPKTWIYAGTVYQLYTFGKRLGRAVDCVVIDEAGQLSLGAASLVLRSLAQSEELWSGKVVIAGDREQLAPIFAGQYPELAEGQRLLFGSVLDCLMDREVMEFGGTGVTTPSDASIDTVVQLLENFRLNPDLGNFVQTIYKRAFKPQKVQAKRVAMQLKRLEDESSWDEVSEKCRLFLLALSSIMLGKNQNLFREPRMQEASKRVEGEPIPADSRFYSEIASTPRPISLALIRLHVRGDPLVEMAYESHVRAEAKVAAALVQLLGKAHSRGTGQREDDTFVACPHRVQRAAVKVELNRLAENPTAEGHRDEYGDNDEELERLIGEMKIESEDESSNPYQLESGNLEPSNRIVVVDTIERLQGAEASFVICLFSHTHKDSISTALPFLLARRRLNVAISRAKTLCIVISSKEVLQPDVSIFADRDSAKGYAFLRDFEGRAWNAELEVQLDH